MIFLVLKAKVSRNPGSTAITTVKFCFAFQAYNFVDEDHVA